MSFVVPDNYIRLRRLVGMIVNTFFYQVEVSGEEHIPKDRGGLLIAWHPNGLIDPALIVSAFPNQVIFGARHGLFRWPILGKLMTSIGTVPIYRREDNRKLNIEEQRYRNAQSLLAMSTAISKGSFSALFPEGISHDQPFLQSLKTGAARIYYQSRKASPIDKPPVIIPVGLYYDHKKTFRSRALIQFHPAMQLPSHLDLIPSEQNLTNHTKALTEEMEKVLTSVIFSVENWTLHETFHRAVKLVRAERIYRAGSKSDKPALEEHVLGLSRVWIGYHAIKDKYPSMVEQLLQDVSEYHQDLEALGINDHDLDNDPDLISVPILLILFIQVFLYLVVFPPVLLVGYVINFPTALAVKIISARYSKFAKDQASVKLFSSIIGFPITWLLWAILGYFGYIQSSVLFPNLPDLSIATSVFVFCFGMLSAVVMFTYLKASQRLLRSIKVRIAKRHNQRSVIYLKQERSRLCDLLTMLADRLDLPGQVGEDGRLKI